jgi:hypothetical protein
MYSIANVWAYVHGVSSDIFFLARPRSPKARNDTTKHIPPQDHDSIGLSTLRCTSLHFSVPSPGGVWERVSNLGK